MQTIKEAINTVAEAISATPKIKDLNTNVVTDCQEGNFITTNFGTRINHTDDSLKSGPRGPTILDDFHFREKMNHFDHERIPERVVHARGYGAHGYFECTQDVSEYTSASFLSRAGKQTPVFVRFSTVLGSRGSADTVRDVRGFAIKFYTDQGNFDLVGNNIPVFFIQDAIKFPDIIHAGKPEPHNEIPQAQTAHDNFWDFISLTPETSHMVMWALSDRAIPRSYRMMQGFGVHSFVLTNASGKRRFVKFHLVPKLGTHSLVWDEALKLAGVDPDFHRRDLFDAIESGAYPEWDVGLQIVDEELEDSFDFDLLDATKIIPEELVPLKIVGKLVLNRNVDNVFAETEQVAFHTGHFVPGIEPSNDPLLQGRLFSYVDTQITRLGGPNFQEIPINRPVCPVTNNQRDGFHRMTVNRGQVNYFPNRFGCPALASGAQGGYIHSSKPDSSIRDGAKVRSRGPKFGEHFLQAQLFYNSLSAWEKMHLIEAAQFELGKVDDVDVRKRMVARFNRIDFDLARQVANAIGVDAPQQFEGQTYSVASPPLSQEITAKNSIVSRRIAFLIADGFDHQGVALLKSAIQTGGALPFFVGPNKGKITASNGSVETAQFSFLTSKSVLFDAIVIAGGSACVDRLNKIGSAKAFVNEAFKHCKPIAAFDEGVDFLAALNWPNNNVQLANNQDLTIVSDQGVVSMRRRKEEKTNSAEDSDAFGNAFVVAITAHRHHQRDIAQIPA